MVASVATRLGNMWNHKSATTMSPARLIARWASQYTVRSRVRIPVDLMPCKYTCAKASKSNPKQVGTLQPGPLALVPLALIQSRVDPAPKAALPMQIIALLIAFSRNGRGVSATKSVARARGLAQEPSNPTPCTEERNAHRPTTIVVLSSTATSAHVRLTARSAIGLLGMTARRHAALVLLLEHALSKPRQQTEDLCARSPLKLKPATSNRARSTVLLLHLAPGTTAPSPVAPVPRRKLVISSSRHSMAAKTALTWSQSLSATNKRALLTAQ